MHRVASSVASRHDGLLAGGVHRHHHFATDTADALQTIDAAIKHMLKRGSKTRKICPRVQERRFIDGRVAGHLGAADGLKTSSIHVCVCPHFGM